MGQRSRVLQSPLLFKRKSSCAASLRGCQRWFVPERSGPAGFLPRTAPRSECGSGSGVHEDRLPSL